MKVFRVRRQSDGAILIESEKGHLSDFGIEGRELHLSQPVAEMFKRHAKVPITIEEVEEVDREDL